MKSFIFCILLSVLFLQVNSQTLDKKAFKKLFQDAEYYFLFEEYEKALEIYLEIFELDSIAAVTNANLNYNIGYCFLQDPVLRYKAFPYLEMAVKHITIEYRPGSYKETMAPYDAYFFLGEAYRYVFEFDKAIFAYEKFKSYLNVSDLFNFEMVECVIQSCNSAKELLLLSEHNYVQVDNLGSTINTGYPEYNPVISGDGTMLIFTSRRKYDLFKAENPVKTSYEDDWDEVEVEADEFLFAQEIFMSKWENEAWKDPVNISRELGADYQTKSVSLSYDGTQLFLCRTEIAAGNIEDPNLYSSKFVDGKWTTMVKLNKNINTRGFETHASLSMDGQKLYFVSEHDNGYGGTDIFMSQLEIDGNWGPAVNLGPSINTQYDENSPVILKDGITLYFSSQGHYNMGGYDVFYSKKISEDAWTVPINIGFPINTMDNNFNFMPVADGSKAFVALESNEGYGNEDIYFLKISSEQEQTDFVAEGSNLEDMINENKGAFSLEDKKISGYIGEETKENSFALPLLVYSQEMSGTEVVEAAYDDVDKILRRAKKMKQESDLAFMIAEEKNQLANEKQREANQILKGLDKITDYNQRKSEEEKAIKLQKEAALYAIISYNLAMNLDGAVKIVTQEADKSKDFAKNLTVKGNSSPTELVDRLNERREQANSVIAKYGSVSAALISNMEILEKKSNGLFFYQHNLKEATEELTGLDQEIKVMKEDIFNLDLKIQSKKNSPKVVELKQQKEALQSKLLEVSSKKKDASERQFNSYQNVKKLDDDILVLTNKVVLLTEFQEENTSGKYTESYLTAKTEKIDKQKLEKEIYTKKIILSPTKSGATENMDSGQEIASYMEKMPQLPDSIPEVAAAIQKIRDENQPDVSINTPATATEVSTNYITYAPMESSAKAADRFELKGTLSLQDNVKKESSLKVTIVNTDNKMVVSTIKPGIPEGNYSCFVPSGTYEFVFEGKGYQAEHKFINIPKVYPRSTVIVNATLVPESVISGQYFVLKSLFFDYGKYELRRESKVELEKLLLLMKNNPTLKIEVIGHTDSWGSDPFNLELSKKRSNTAINYLVDNGIDKTRFVAKGMGKSHFIAINENDDGTDNPDGRQYNRRVEIKLLNSVKNVQINQPELVPGNLSYRKNENFQPNDNETSEHVDENHLYTIQLIALQNPIDVAFFEDLSGIKISKGNDGLYRYTYKEISGLSAAREMANILVSKGYKQAFAVRIPESTTGSYAIQLGAYSKKANSAALYGLKNVREIIGKDGLFRYWYGDYPDKTSAEQALLQIAKKGFPNAFVVDLLEKE